MHVMRGFKDYMENPGKKKANHDNPLRFRSSTFTSSEYWEWWNSFACADFDVIDSKFQND